MKLYNLKGVKLAEEIRSLPKPIFVTGAKKEIDEVREAFLNVKAGNITLFDPMVDGFHGSKTLCESVMGYETFWEPLERFLFKHAIQNGVTSEGPPAKQMHRKSTERRS